MISSCSSPTPGAHRSQRLNPRVFDMDASNVKPRPWPELEEALPPLSSWERAKLKESIDREGIIHPILCLPDGRIIDGHHRWRIAGEKAPIVVLPLEELRALELGFDLNLNRRQLSKEQIEDILVIKDRIIKAVRKAGGTQKEAASAANVSKRTVQRHEAKEKKDDTCRISAKSGRPEKQIPKAERKKIYEEHLSQKSQREIGAEHKIPQRTISRIIEREKERREPKAIPLPPTTIEPGEVIYADPPWRYDFSETESREVENQYPTMTLEKIIEHGVPATDDAVLFLWATAPKLREALRVMEAWGFEYKTNAVWDKQKIGMGYWFRGQHELLLVGTKGAFSPPPEECRFLLVISEPRGKHSVKPKAAREMIEKMFPGKDKIELFGRENHPGWRLWGNEIQ